MPWMAADRSVYSPLIALDTAPHERPVLSNRGPGLNLPLKGVMGRVVLGGNDQA